MPSLRRNFIWWATIIILSSLLTIYIWFGRSSLSSNKTSPRPPNESSDSVNDSKYHILFDAGSSGTRLVVYRWHKNTIQGDESVILPEIIKVNEHIRKPGAKCRNAVMPGISSFVSNIDGIDEYFDNLLCFAQSLIPKSKWPETEVFVMATAGMRLLPVSQSSAIIGAICDKLSRSGFHHPATKEHCRSHVKIITGEEEGLYGWLAVNYLFKTLGNHKARTYGFLDMGGASAQIAYEPHTTAQLQHADDLFNITLSTAQKDPKRKSTDYHVYVTTFLGYGANQAMARHFDNLSLALSQDEAGPNGRQGGDLDRGSSASPILDPCSPKGMINTVPITPFNVTSRSDKSETVPISQITIEGTGNFQQCLDQCERLLNKSDHCTRSPCFFNDVHFPGIDYGYSRFVAVSEYWYSMYDILGLGGEYDSEVFKDKVQGFCQTNWDDIVSELENGNHVGNNKPDQDENAGSEKASDLDAHLGLPQGIGKKWRERKVTIERLQKQCFKASWIWAMIHSGFGVPRNTDTSDAGAVNRINKSLPKSRRKDSISRNEAVENVRNSTLVLDDDGMPHAPKRRMGISEYKKKLLKEAKAAVSDKPIPILQSLDDINGNPISWTMGAALLYAINVNDITNASNSSKQTPYWFYSLLLLMTIAIVGLVFRWYKNKYWKDGWMILKDSAVTDTMDQLEMGLWGPPKPSGMQAPSAINHVFRKDPTSASLVAASPLITAYRQNPTVNNNNSLQQDYVSSTAQGFSNHFQSSNAADSKSSAPAVVSSIVPTNPKDTNTLRVEVPSSRVAYEHQKTSPFLPHRNNFDGTARIARRIGSQEDVRRPNSTPVMSDYQHDHLKTPPAASTTLKQNDQSPEQAINTQINVPTLHKADSASGGRLSLGRAGGLPGFARFQQHIRSASTGRLGDRGVKWQD